jgi:FG-GAP-like repeat/FG-GAP repeat
LKPDTACSRRWQGAVGPRSCALLLVGVGAALTSGGSSSSAIWAAPERPVFAEPQRYATAKVPQAVAIGDLNGDGRRDLAAAATTDATEAGRVTVLLNRGGGSFRTARTYRTGLFSMSVAIGELNGDGKPDLALANLKSRSISVLLNRGQGDFQERVNYATASEAWDIAIGDLNGDGRSDLAIASTNFVYGDGSVSRVSVFINSGDGSLGSRVDYRPARGSVSIAIGDLNGDGRPDLATANRSDTISVFTNRGDGRFRPRVDYRGGRSPQSIAIGDMNADGRSDLVTANQNITGGKGGRQLDSVSVLLNRGKGAFGPRVDYVAHTPTSHGLTFGSVAIGDLNGDGKRDVAVGTTEDRICVFVNRGNGRLRPRVEYRTSARPSDEGWGPRSVALGHLNGDRKLDVVTVKFASVAVLLNRTRA